MRASKTFPLSRILLILCLLASSTYGCSALVARASQRRSSPESKEHFPGRGIRITEVWQGSPGERAGLKVMDVIFRYADFEILDDASYFAARDAHENGRDREIPIVIWRDGKALKLTVPPGKLGIITNEYNPVAYQFSSLMMKLEALRQIPEYTREHEFKDSYTPDDTLRQAKNLIDLAEREGTLTPTQILVARIYMVPDDASPEDLKRQSEMLVQLISTQPESYIHMLSQDRFFESKHYRPAVECFKRHLEAHPDDVALRLNMGVAYYRLGMFTEAGATADYVLDHEPGLNDHGVVVAYQIKAMGALSRGDYSKTISLGEQAFDLEQCNCDIERVMLAAAETGDLQKFAEASHRYQEALPAEFEKRKLQLAALEALALARSNQLDRARELTREWKDTDRIEGRLKAYWKIYPGGSDVWTNWNELTRN